MKLSDLVSPDRVVVPLRSDSLPAAARELLDRLTASGVVSQPERLRDRVEEKRPEDLVAMGDRAFLLHYRSDAVRELVVAIGVAPAPIERELGESDETQAARVILLVAAPPKQAALYLATVGAFARLLSKPHIVEEVLGQSTAEGLAALPVFRDLEVRDQLAVRDLMTSRPRSVSPDTPLRDAALDMVRAGVAGLPVVDDGGRVIGMLGQRELLQHMLTNYLQRGGHTPPASDARTRTVRDVMTRQVLCVSPEQPLAEVASMMSNKDVDRVPVVREGRLVGFLTRGDIVRKLIGSLRDRVGALHQHDEITRSMAGNRTLAIIKPDAFGAQKAGKIIALLEEKGFALRGAKVLALTDDRAGAFYAVHRERPFYASLVEFMTSGPCMPLVLEKDGAVAALREAIGATDPAEAAEGTVRKLYAESKGRNAIHASDSDENAANEIAFFFPGSEALPTR